MPWGRTGLVGAAGVTVAIALTASACGHEKADPPGGRRPTHGKGHASAPASPGGVARHGDSSSVGVDKRVTAALAGIPDGIEGAEASQWRLSIDEGYLPLQRWPKDGRVRRVADGSAREGEHKLRFEIAPRPTSFRAEISRPVVPMGSDCWYGFSIYLPADWRRDPKGTIMAQWHAEVGRPVPNFPNVALYVLADTWQVRTNWNTRGDTSQVPGWRKKAFRLGPVRKGAWTDWVLRGKWSPKRDGLLQVWQNGRQVIDHRGPTTYVNDTGPYFKMGLYHPKWRYADARIPPGSRTLVSYADAVRLTCAGEARSGRPR